MRGQITFVSLLVILLSSNALSRRKKRCREKESENSFLWALKRDPPVYFFGTIHVPYTRVWNHVSQTAKQAFEASENVFFELDLTDPKTLASLSRCQMLPGGTKLHQVLPDGIYQRLKRHLSYVKEAMPNWLSSEQKGKGIYAGALYDAIAGNWQRKKPIWVMLMVNSLNEADIKTRGTPVLDLHLARRAERMGKTIGAVEKVEEQCQPLNGLNSSQVLFVLNQTLMIQEKRRRGDLEDAYSTDDLVEQYNCGSLDPSMLDKEAVQVPAVSNHSGELVEPGGSKAEKRMASGIDSYFKKELIYHRNERMASRMHRLLEENPRQSFFFAIGAGHFLGSGSVFDFLKRYNYEVERVKKDISFRNTVAVRHASLDKRGRKARKRGRGPMRRAGKERRRRRKRKKRKQHKRLDLPVGERPTFNVLSSYDGVEQLDGEYPFMEQADIRIINHYPTVFPTNFYRDWSHFRRNRRRNRKRPSSLHKKRHSQATKRSKHFSSHHNPLAQSFKFDRIDTRLWKPEALPDLPGGSASHKVKAAFFQRLLYILPAVLVTLNLQSQ